MSSTPKIPAPSGDADAGLERSESPVPQEAAESLSLVSTLPGEMQDFGKWLEASLKLHHDSINQTVQTQMEALLGGTLLKKGCEEVNTADALKGKRAVGLYFSAHWCPPCRGFTPKLA